MAKPIISLSKETLVRKYTTLLDNYENESSVRREIEHNYSNLQSRLNGVNTALAMEREGTVKLNTALDNARAHIDSLNLLSHATASFHATREKYIKAMSIVGLATGSGEVTK